jgi:beta-glucanase (GH16 family)
MRTSEGCRVSGRRHVLAAIAALGMAAFVPLATGTVAAGPASAAPRAMSKAGPVTVPAKTVPTTTVPAKTVPTTTVPTTTTTTTPAPTCGGTTTLKSNGTAWRCTFDDEFNGTSLNTANWVPQQTANSGYTSGGECYTGSPNNVSESGGTLSLTVRKEAAPFTCADPAGNYTTQYTGGMVSTDGKFSQTYGLFEVRAKLPAAAVAGLQESFWLWPVNDAAYGSVWPASGEIDFAEMYSLYPNLDVPYIHYNAAAPDPNVTTYTCTIADQTQFHTYGLQWTPTSISILLDGKTCLTDSWHPAAPLTAPAPFNQPFFLILTQALGITTNAFSAARTPLPGTTQVDWVRIWS